MNDDSLAPPASNDNCRLCQIATPAISDTSLLPRTTPAWDSEYATVYLPEIPATHVKRIAMRNVVAFSRTNATASRVKCCSFARSCQGRMIVITTTTHQRAASFARSWGRVDRCAAKSHASRSNRRGMRRPSATPTASIGDDTARISDCVSAELTALPQGEAIEIRGTAGCQRDHHMPLGSADGTSV